jgi:hypothetical protein
MHGPKYPGLEDGFVHSYFIGNCYSSRQDRKPCLVGEGGLIYELLGGKDGQNDVVVVTLPGAFFHMPQRAQCENRKEFVTRFNRAANISQTLSVYGAASGKSEQSARHLPQGGTESRATSSMQPWTK